MNTTTKHTHSPNFGRRVDGCPRCAELNAGAMPRQWRTSRRDRDEARRSEEIRAHFASEYHRSGRCGPVCTFGEW